MSFIKWLRVEQAEDRDVNLLAGYLRMATDLPDQASPLDVRIWLVDRQAAQDLFDGLEKASAAWIAMTQPHR